jgi:hypothetical protein
LKKLPRPIPMPARSFPTQSYRNSVSSEVCNRTHFNTSRLQPPRKPETVAPGLESKRNPFDHLADLDRLVTPALHQSQQRIRIRPKFFQGLAVNAGRHSSHKPARLAHFNDNYQSGVLIKGDERAAQVINLGHAEPAITFIQRP